MSSHSDVEKGAGVRDSFASVQQPHDSYVAHQGAFPPRYTEAVNDEMRRFPELQGQTGNREPLQYDEPAKRDKRRSGLYWALLALIILCFAASIGTGLGFYLTRNKSAEGNGQTSLQTRDVETTVTIYTTLSASTTSTSSSPATVTHTVFQTLSASPSTSTPQTSTVTAVVTQSPPETPTVTVTSTTTLAAGGGGAIAPSPPTTLSAVTVTPSPPPNAAEQAARSSIAAELSRLAQNLTPSAIPSDSTWLASTSTSTSTTILMTTPEAAPATTTQSVLPTHTGWVGRCGVPGESC
ncbi:Hypothetical predicted protein [Lecanosticta acicola]|uniref:Uncharacterized protein n=1 Tax=Lecanosticta acicola TaxID=111012 RepID=A0AAI8Z4Z3_9PEZI|nr:Hypothetical predicted protein [Lecanosticta acicola]